MSQKHKHPSKNSSKRPPAASDALAWLYGLHPVRAALQNPRRKCLTLYLERGSKMLAEWTELAAQTPSHPTILQVDDFDALPLPLDAVHQGVVLKAYPLETLSLETLLRKSPENACFLVLDQLQDPHNLGAILRSAAAFGATAVLIPDRSSAPLSPIAAKSAAGALEHIPLVRIQNVARTLEDLKQAGFWCFGLDERGVASPAETKLEGRIALVLGSEGDGLRPLVKTTCDALLRLPTATHFGTLNVSNAAAVCLYEWRRQQNGTVS